MSPSSTDCKADALTTTLSCWYNAHFDVMIYRAKFDARNSSNFGEVKAHPDRIAIYSVDNVSADFSEIRSGFPRIRILNSVKSCFVKEQDM